jgi:hypothetical protein
MKSKYKGWSLILNREDAVRVFERLKADNDQPLVAYEFAEPREYPCVFCGTYDPNSHMASLGCVEIMEYMTINQFRHILERTREDLRNLESVERNYELWDS